METTTFDLDAFLTQATRPKAVIAGYAGRDQDKVREHIEELAALGVAPPENIPEFYPVQTETITQASEIPVSPHTSGEAEPVLIRTGGKYLLAVGSDHTDRKVEAESVLDSKRACAKPISREALVFSRDLQEQHWDHLILSSNVDGRPYQKDQASLLPIFETLRIYQERFGTDGEDLILFGGTVPLLTGEFAYGTRWDIQLHLAGQTLVLQYEAHAQSAAAPTA